MAAFIDIGKGREFGIGTGQHFTHKLHAACARSDDAEPDAVIRAQHLARGRKGAGDSGCHFPDKITA